MKITLILILFSLSLFSVSNAGTRIIREPGKSIGTDTVVTVVIDGTEGAKKIADLFGISEASSGGDFLWMYCSNPAYCEFSFKINSVLNPDKVDESEMLTLVGRSTKENQKILIAQTSIDPSEHSFPARFYRALLIKNESIQDISDSGSVIMGCTKEPTGYKCSINVVVDQQFGDIRLASDERHDFFDQSGN